MKAANEGEAIIIRLDDGEDLFQSLEEAVRRYGGQNGVVVFGIGQLKHFELGYFDSRTYSRKTYDEPHELVDLQGTITLNSDPKFHLHAALSGGDLNLIGGHLFKAAVATVGEIFVQTLKRVRIDRQLDTRTGLKRLDIW